MGCVPCSHSECCGTFATGGPLHASAEVADPGDAGDDEELAAKRLEQAENRRKALEFLGVTGVFDEVHILYKSLQAEQRYMNSFLHMSSVAWKMQQAALFAATGDRSYQVFNMLSPSLWIEYCDAALTLLQDDESWSHLNFTLRNSTNILRFVAHAASVIFELVVLPARGFPLKLMKLLDPTEDRRSLAEAFLSEEAKCSHDSFTKTFLEKFCTVEEVCGEHALLTLRMLAEALEGNTHSTERLHSVNLRQARKRETHVADLTWLTLQHQRFAGLAWLTPSSSQLLHKSLAPSTALQTEAGEASEHPASSSFSIGGSLASFVNVWAVDDDNDPELSLPVHPVAAAPVSASPTLTRPLKAPEEKEVEVEEEEELGGPSVTSTAAALALLPVASRTLLGHIAISQARTRPTTRSWVQMQPGHIT